MYQLLNTSSRSSKCISHGYFDKLLLIRGQLTRDPEKRRAQTLRPPVYLLTVKLRPCHRGQLTLIHVLLFQFE